MTADIIIYHNPECGTSRNTLALIRNAGIEPHVVEYLKTPPSRALLERLIERAGITPRELLREKGTPYAELGLGNPDLTDGALIDAMMAHPVLINRPLVVTSLGVKLCRPSEAVLDIIPARQLGAFAKEDGEQVVDAGGNRVHA
ncbi:MULTISPECIES: arsenate reductase (glutaredoxin) [Sphingopyxis]|jgi:arsenate reductase|uniref:Arsenate reductase n=2 Tax=Sphingopyxis TaxID=165697 RepID=A0A239K5Z0_9SPHN|nr:MULTISPECIES: arsenate reductase (glutaredoxin) [Sphingopyxis]AMG72474.1 Arsenate reductase [Sphingopyxis granuli]APZ99694.1 arsenate reductase (glutaredoxin) [Sphingopyxis sp. QXT-31]KTE18341.1 arsenate reductase [Sphingopyxis sp. H050]MBL8650267.1 arsenate reductase (glutaredoxin) [Sphingopyxis sp.]MBR2172979.1 arsenate reductase (glutaredoxin) [Sphingopyxis sp.]